MYLHVKVIMFPRDKIFIGGKTPEELSFFLDVKSHSTNYERMQSELIIVFLLLPFLVWLTAISTLFGGPSKVFFFKTYYYYWWKDATEWLMGLRVTRLLASTAFDVWGDIFCIANLEWFLNSSISRLLAYMQIYGSRAAEAVEVVSETRRSSGVLISWEYFFEIYLRNR